MAGLPTSKLGRTELQVTKLGYGAMELRGGGGSFGRDVSSDLSKTLLNSVLDGGINFIDTSPDYGSSEELIGEHISHRRQEFYIASKCGCPINQPRLASGERPPHTFTPENVRAGVEQSLKRMKTDYLDVVQFHVSPSRAVLEENDAIETLRTLQREGKLRFLGMSGTLPNLTDHIAMGVFDAFQIPYSAVEREHEEAISTAARAGAGTIIRGGVARGAPSDDQDPGEIPDFWRKIVEQRRALWQNAKLDDLLEGGSAMDFMLRFTITHPDMHTTIVGTANPDHLADNLAALRAGPLSDDVYAEAKRRLSAAASGE
jgi:aryl-alcohol dehydrogenase-like predicted oxidoreductase